MSAAAWTRQPPAVAAAPAGAVVVPERVARRAAAAGWARCDVCCWPVDPAGVVPGRRPRHPGCICPACEAPLTGVQPGRLFHPPCDPHAALVRSARRGRLALVVGGGGR